MILTRWRPMRLVERNVLVTRQSLLVFVAGFLEPVLFLLSIGFGVGGLVGDVTVVGKEVSYQQFVAPGLLAVAAMNGVIFDTTFNFYVKLRYMRTYDAVLATPLGPVDVAQGELAFAVGRVAVYSTGFMVTMALFGLTPSLWTLATVPVALAMGFGFGGAGLAATTWMRSFVDFDKVWIVVIPLFLFSGTFFPLEQYPGWAATIVRLGPLYQGVEASRLLVMGQPSWSIVGNVVYLLVMGAVGLRVAGRRIGPLLVP